MKKSYVVIAVMAIVVSVAITSCGGTKQVASAQQQSAQNGGGNPFGDTYEAPCTMYDDDAVFTGFSSAEGPKVRLDVVRRAALANAQSIMRQKIKHVYKGMVNDYSNLIGDNSGNNAASNFEAAGSQMIDAIVNDTKEKCVKMSSLDAKGNITVFIGIEVSKGVIVDKIADKLSENAELKIRFNEANFREQMEKKFKDYKETQQ